MTYDTSILSDLDKMNKRIRHLVNKSAIIDLTEKRLTRSLSQSRYLHAIIRGCALEIGVSASTFKEKIWKSQICPTFFITHETDKSGRVYDIVRSETDLNTLEYTQCIEMLRTHMIEFHGYYVPSPEEHVLVEQMYEETQGYGTKEFIDAN